MAIPPDSRPDDVVWPQAEWPPPPALEGAHVTLTQFVPDDAPELFAALDHDACWDHVAGRPSSPGEYAATLAQAPQAGRWPWVVRQGGQVVGTTSYLDVSLPDARLEIGSTAYSPSAWATEVNPECKLLLMSWAFDHGFGRVQLKTDIRNRRSQAAITKLGATSIIDRADLSAPGKPFQRAAGEVQGRLARRQIDHPHLAPADSHLQAGAKRLGTGLFRGPAFGIGGGNGARAAFGLALFAVGKDTVLEAVAKAGNRCLDPFDIGKIGPDPKDHASPSRARSMRRRISRIASSSPR